jgi:putative SOS response-associated peptidase YedK
MCGRFVGYRGIAELKSVFPIDLVEAKVSSNYNVAPTQNVLSIIRKDNSNVLTGLYWGLVPFWAKDTKIGYRMINARAETVASKPAFRNAFKKRRCLIPADGFYEWKGKAGKKQPMYITLPDEGPFAFAGLWEIWDRDEEAEKPLMSCTILTTDASPSIEHIHNRMPVILNSAAYQGWMNQEMTEIDLDNILEKKIHKEFSFRPVSKAVNSVKNNSPELIAKG